MFKCLRREILSTENAALMKNNCKITIEMVQFYFKKFSAISFIFKTFIYLFHLQNMKKNELSNLNDNHKSNKRHYNQLIEALEQDISQIHVENDKIVEDINNITKEYNERLLEFTKQKNDLQQTINETNKSNAITLQTKDIENNELLLKLKKAEEIIEQNRIQCQQNDEQINQQLLIKQNDEETFNQKYNEYEQKIRQMKMDIKQLNEIYKKKNDEITEITLNRITHIDELKKQINEINNKIDVQSVVAPKNDGVVANISVPSDANFTSTSNMDGGSSSGSTFISRVDFNQYMQYAESIQVENKKVAQI